MSDESLRLMLLPPGTIVHFCGMPLELPGWTQVAGNPNNFDLVQIEGGHQEPQTIKALKMTKAVRHAG